jgi:HD-like signal output (HDOD) protein/CheY-like chemotaxis protein
MQETPALPLIVVLDDEMSILRALQSLLHRHPFRLQAFSESAEALKFITRQTPDIIISDMRMPEMSGADFLSKARSICPVSMRLLLSGFEDKKVIVDAIGQGIAQMYILKPWEDEEILNILHSALDAREQLRTKNLDTFIHGIKSLPSSPFIQAQIKQVFKKSDRSVKDVAAEVEKDPGLVAQLVRVANSVFFGGRNPIANIQEAVRFIGLEYVEGLILGTGMFKSLAEGADGAATKAIQDLWHHAMNRAFVARAIASRWSEYPHLQPAYLAGLLLDIGFVVRLQVNSKEFLHMTQLARELRIPLHQAEPKLFDVLHTEIGAALLRLWNFPPEIVGAIEGHHSEHAAHSLTRLVQMADVIEAADFARLHDTTLNPTIEQLQKDLFTSKDSPAT